MDWSVRNPPSSKSHEVFETKVVMNLKKIQEELTNINRILAKYDNMIMGGIGEEE